MTPGEIGDYRKNYTANKLIVPGEQNTRVFTLEVVLLVTTNIPLFILQYKAE